MRKTLGATAAAAAALALTVMSSPAWADDAQTTHSGVQTNWVDGPNRINCHNISYSNPGTAYCGLLRPDGVAVYVVNPYVGTTGTRDFTNIAENQPIAIRACIDRGAGLDCGDWKPTTS